MANPDSGTAQAQPLRPPYLPALSALFLILFLTGLTGCRPVGGNPATDPRALEMARAAQQTNAALITSKGQGTLTFVNNEFTETFRLAWAAQAPDRLRLTLLSSGHPVETIAASGEWVSIISHTGRHTPHSAVSTDPDLTPYINVPLRLSDLISLLLGRPPVQPFDRAWFEAGGNGLVRTAKTFLAQTQTLSFDRDGRLRHLALWDEDGVPVFTLETLAFQTIDSHVLPKTLEMTDGRGNRITLALSSFLPNPPVKESVFRLTATGS